MDDRQKRANAKLEASLRNSNDRVAESQAGNEIITRLFCECGLGGCGEKLSIAATSYAAIRSHERRFLVASDHAIPQAESVIEDNGVWLVVEKPKDVERVLQHVHDLPH